MALILQDFNSWAANKSIKRKAYLLPTNKSSFTVVSANFISLENTGLWNNLVNGDFVNLSSVNTLPNPLTSQKYYINKAALPRISLHLNKNDAVDNTNPVNITNAGVGVHTLSFEFNRVLKCITAGHTGTNEPLWNRLVNSIVNDGTCIWQVINPLYTEFNPWEFLPAERQKEDAWIKYSEMLAHTSALAEKEIKPLKDKYRDYLNLDQAFVNELFYEFGYEYLVEASILDTNQLATLLSYLKLIHFLKGTREGLQLVLDLLGYQYSEKLWYEKTPLGQTNTFDLNLTVNVNSLNINTVNGLNKFLSYYVFAVPNIATEILPFKFLETGRGGGGVGDQIHEFVMDFEIPITPNNALFLLKFQDDYGSIVTDDSGIDNDAQIIQTGNHPDLLYKLIYSQQVNPVNDLSTNNNDAAIISSPVEYKLFKFSYTEGSGSNIDDESLNNNNSQVIASPLHNYKIIGLNYTEGSGATIENDYPDGLPAEIIASPVYNYQLIGLEFTDGTGTTITNTNTAAGDSEIIATSDIPRPDNLQGYYKLNSDADDYSGNARHAALTGGDFTTGVSLTLGDTDYLTIPNNVLNGVNNFTYGGWFKFTNVNYASVDPTYLEQNCFISCQSGIYPHLTVYYSKMYKGFFGKLNNENIYFNVAGDVADFVGHEFVETGDHHIVLTRVNNLISLFIDCELIGQSNCPTGNIIVDSGGLIVGQRQNGGVGAGLSTIQSLNGDVDNLFFYNVALDHSEIIKWYEKARA